MFKRTAFSSTLPALLASAALMVVGCQSAGTSPMLRAPGAASVPPVANPPAANPVTANGTNDSVSASLTDQAVMPVGFVERLHARQAENGGGCLACNQGAPCNDCGPAGGCAPNFMMPMRQPVDPQEFLCNGGDMPPEARVLRDDRVAGLQPQDAIVHYTTEAGDIELQASNRACVYSPRFGAVRQISGAVAGEKAIGLRGTFQPLGPNRIGLTQPSLVVQDVNELGHADVARRVDAMRDRNRGVPVDGIVQLEVAEDALQILATLDFIALNRLDESQLAILQQGAVAAQSWMIRDAVEVMIESLQPPVLTRDARAEAFVEYDFPDAGRLQIMKVADRSDAQQGEEVTFAIRVRNIGDSAVNKVEIVDSLVARLEYVEGSQTCDREAEFETSGNAAGSVRMKWQLAEPLAVGESALIEFKCKVR
ncbi:DUF11 domain-containing protein [Stieleria sp. TO1_6]|uniref:DUF11 domain-containing protein n=1 Tax=Stieleria tagensis TaxID=2956795 RepID=UPI00209A9B79|nr:DUF11 domain-containing protein [Stieleria tagensis]MCO8125058.1 DUF11 domain-containing protein [Stieleria tagensis]